MESSIWAQKGASSREGLNRQRSVGRNSLIDWPSLSPRIVNLHSWIVLVLKITESTGIKVLRATAFRLVCYAIYQCHISSRCQS